MKNTLFTLSRRHQKGQVAIFVALIFQVVFIFFAILINIGLLVHHKINLQQSTDLAAYYGAMKQSELMNAIAHVNFQMRQAWKLLTWRYRIAGSFAFQPSRRGGVPQIVFPLSLDFNGSVPTAFTGAAAEAKCPSGVNILDVPFFCGGHSGFQGWPTSNENNCQIDCGHIANSPSFINAIPLTGGYDNPYTGGVAGAVNAALNQANATIADLCNDLGPSGFASVAKFIIAYSAEVQKKKKLIQMLGANLSAGVTESRDMNGGLILDGASRTFDNNLTEANLTGKISFTTVNGLTQSGSACPFQGNASDGEDTRGQFLTEIKFDGIQFFIHQCTGSANTTKNFVPVSIFDSAASPAMSQITSTLFPGSMSSPADRTNLTNAITSTEYIIGYEKNPWCQVYYAAKAQVEPKIPFLPLSKVRLSAVSVAKPFGGTVGPRYNALWPFGNSMSNGGGKVDATLPERKFSGIPPGPPLVQYQAIIPNYANFVGDTKGLKDPFVAGAYEDILLHRQMQVNIPGLSISQNKEPAGGMANGSSGLQAATTWPAFSNWFGLVDPSTTNPDYDYIAKAAQVIGANRNSFMRDLEISVIAPNQFDLTYYSIDPDFYNNYYLKIRGGTAGAVTYPGSYNRLIAAANGSGPTLAEINPDYGYNATMENSGAIARNYSVRHQIAVASLILKETPQRAAGAGRLNRDIFNFIPNKASSVLTGWTFQDFSHYVDSTGTNFPNLGPDPQNTMTFAKCRDEGWNNTTDTSVENSFDTPVSDGLPPTPGNCVWGGRTGYSVKLISPSLIRTGAPPQPYGGPGVSGTILNPIDENFFTF